MYRLFSRCQGWLDGIPVRTFYTDIIEDTQKIIDSFNLYGLTGHDIIKILNKNNIKHKKLLELSRIYGNWYLYDKDTEIYSSLSL